MKLNALYLNIVKMSSHFFFLVIPSVDLQRAEVMSGILFKPLNFEEVRMITFENSDFSCIRKCKLTMFGLFRNIETLFM